MQMWKFRSKHETLYRHKGDYPDCRSFGLPKIKKSLRTAENYKSLRTAESFHRLHALRNQYLEQKIN